MQNVGKYSMFLGLLVLITALTISGIAIYYSVAGLVAIFAAAALPIMIMGGALEIGKLVTAVWLHRYWKQCVWWLKTYLTIAVVVLMLITSMGIFGFLSKAHIEQTSASEESIAKIETIESETARLNSIIERAETKIKQLESSGTGADTNIQNQIDKEQERIDKAFDRIQPAIDQQNKIIEDARASDNSRTKPYEDQLASIQAEILRLETTAREYEDKIANLKANQGAVDPLLQQIKKIEEEIIRVTNQLQSTEKSQIRAGQAIIGVTSDGLFGGNTREALAKWVAAQQDRIAQIQGEISQLRKDATTTVDNERKRLAEVVKDIRTVQIPALKDRELTMLEKIDEVRQTESPAIKTARDEIQRLRKSAEDQVKQSQSLIERLQKQLANSDNADEIQKSIDEQNERIRTASNEIEVLTDEKIILQAEYRKLEAEVGPIKYIAEFIYGEQADKNLLEEAVRWVIITIIFVFDPLAVLLLIASQYTFDFNRRKDDSGERLRQERADYERLRAQKIADNPGFNNGDSTQDEEVNEEQIVPESSGDVEEQDNQSQDSEEDQQTQQILESDESIETVQEEAVSIEEALKSEEPKEVDVEKKDQESSEESNQRLTSEEFDALDDNDDWKTAKTQWKQDNPQETLKEYKDFYLQGKIDELPWEKYLPEGVDLKKKRSYIMKEKGQQIRKESEE
jgi:HAMP domain-containing protein